MTRTETRVELSGLPPIIASGVAYPPEPEVGIDWWVADELDWHGAERALTPEEEHAVELRAVEVEEAVTSAYLAARRAARG